MIFLKLNKCIILEFRKKEDNQQNLPKVIIWFEKTKENILQCLHMTKNKVNSRATCNFIQIISKIQFNAESLLLTLDFFAGFPILIMNFSTEFS